MIDPKLETLLRVAEAGSFTQAAKSLSLTQPAASQHVTQLEKELGVRIFNRSEGQLRLTGEGELVLGCAKRMRMLYQNLRQSLRDYPLRAMRLSVGITHTAESSLIAEVLAQYCSEPPGVRLTILTDTINNLYEKLKTYEIDIAVVEGKVHDASFNSILIDTDCLVLAVANESPLAQKSSVTLDELKKENLILRLPSSGTRNLFVSHLESNGMSIDEFNIILEVDNIATIKDLIRRGFGVSILAKSACYDEASKGKIRLLPVENLGMIREVNLVYTPDFGHVSMLHDIARIYEESLRFRRSGVRGIL